jgi:hypothetical protein
MMRTALKRVGAAFSLVCDDDDADDAAAPPPCAALTNACFICNAIDRALVRKGKVR